MQKKRNTEKDVEERKEDSNCCPGYEGVRKDAL